MDTLIQRFREINACGLVLSFCQLDHLKCEIQATFGDWELIALMIRTLRAREKDYGQLDELQQQSRAQSMEPMVASMRKYSTGNSAAGVAGNASSSLATAMARRRGRSARKKTVSGSGNTVDYNSSSDQVAEVVAQQDWLHNRLGHLDSVEFIGQPRSLCFIQDHNFFLF